MKHYWIVLMITALVISSCRKTDEPELAGTFSTTVLPSFVKDAATDINISAVDPASFQAKFSMDLFFKNGKPPQKMDIVITKNGNNSIVKTLQADVTSFPVTLTITGDQLTSLFGAPVVLGNYFDIGANITLQNGQYFEAFPAVGLPYGSNVNQQSGGINLTLRYAALCVFDAASFAGNFKVMQDDADFFGVGAVIPVSMADASNLSITFPVNNQQPVKITVDASNNASVIKQVIGDFDDGFGNVSAESVAGNDNYVSPCDGIISLNIEYTVAAGSYGNYLLKLKKIQ